MTRLRKMMLEELQRRNYSDSTTRYYLQGVAAFAKHFEKPPDKLGADELRTYQVYLLKECKLAVGTVIANIRVINRRASSSAVICPTVQNQKAGFPLCRGKPALISNRQTSGIDRSLHIRKSASRVEARHPGRCYS